MPKRTWSACVIRYNGISGCLAFAFALQRCAPYVEALIGCSTFWSRDTLILVAGASFVFLYRTAAPAAAQDEPAVHRQRGWNLFYKSFRRRLINWVISSFFRKIFFFILVRWPGALRITFYHHGRLASISCPSFLPRLKNVPDWFSLRFATSFSCSLAILLKWDELRKRTWTLNLRKNAWLVLEGCSHIE